MKEKWFAFYWMGGTVTSPTYHKGESSADAAMKAGYGAADLKKLGSTEEAKFIPLRLKDVILIEDGVKQQVPADGSFHQELFKYLEAGGESVRQHELTVSIGDVKYTLDVEVRKFEITAVTLWKSSMVGGMYTYKLQSDDGLYGFKYDQDSQRWKVVPNSSEKASEVTGTLPSWREAELYCARLNDPDEFTTFICIDDKQAFPMSIEQQEWFKERDLSVPKRCSMCRDRKRDEKQMDDVISIAQQDGICDYEIQWMKSAIEDYISKYGERWIYLQKARKRLREWEMQSA